MSYTLEDLQRAEEELRRLREAWENDRSNNPNKYRSEIQSAAQLVRIIKDELKALGTIAMSDEEKLTVELDKLYPNAKSRSIVNQGGNRYQIRYFPLQFSRSGKTVMEWGHKWILIGKAPPG